MGLSACGQFLLSYTERWVYVDAEPQNDFRLEKLEYKLYFWGFRPHNPCYIVNSVVLFDDHGVDHYLNITMVQWKCAPWLVVVHGNSNCERSYITWAAVPSLGCVSCKKLSLKNYDKDRSESSLCIRHRVLIHTKYDCGLFDPVFTPYVSMRCTGYIVVNTGAVMHVMNADLQTIGSLALGKPQSWEHKKRKNSLALSESLLDLGVAGTSREPLYDYNCQYSVNNIDVDSSFSDTHDDKVISSDDSAIEESDNELLLASENLRSRMAEQAYEFVEDSENCEKISLFRKRRLADKKYEFREETHADTPFLFGFKFNKYIKLNSIVSKCLYSAQNNFTIATSQRSPNPILKPTTILPVRDITVDLEKTSPSPVKQVIIKSNGELPEVIANTSLITKRKSSLALEYDDAYKCALKFTRYYTEKSDASDNTDNTVPADDLLPSGIHIALSIGSSNLQIVSNEECEYLSPDKPVVSVTQQSFDMETFCYLISTKLCEKQKKLFKSVQDWYCEILKVSPVSGVTCLMLIHLVAIPRVASKLGRLRPGRCRNCIEGDCMEHRRDYEAKCLFQWDLESGDYSVIKHTDLVEIKAACGQEQPQMWRPSRFQAVHLINSIEQDNIGWNMRVQNTHLNTKVSFQTITDWDHFIQLNRKRVNSDNEDSDVDSDTLL